MTYFAKRYTTGEMTMRTKFIMMGGTTAMRGSMFICIGEKNDSAQLHFKTTASTIHRMALHAAPWQVKP